MKAGDLENVTLVIHSNVASVTFPLHSTVLYNCSLSIHEQLRYMLVLFIYLPYSIYLFILFTLLMLFSILEPD